MKFTWMDVIEAVVFAAGLVVVAMDVFVWRAV